MQNKTENQGMVGWDIGGAHLKAALLNSQAEVLVVYQQACPLWQGLDTLEQAVTAILAKLPEQDLQHAITMTGELVDLFSDKAQGVQAIIDLMQQRLGTEISVYAGRLGFIRADLVQAEHSEAIASANWLASADYVAQQLGQGLFIDMGSTTTDLLLLNKHQVDALGYTDYQRLISSELVYTGIVRTAVMAVVQDVQFAGVELGVMSEYFATMADVYRLTNELDEQHDQMSAADDGAKTVAASAQRLARMIGCDKDEFSLEQWQALALNIRQQQLERVQQAAEKQLSRLDKDIKISIIGAGIGRFLCQEIAGNLGLDYIGFDDLFSAPKQQSQMQIADCAPAVAVAYLRLSIS